MKDGVCVIKAYNGKVVYYLIIVHSGDQIGCSGIDFL